MLHLVLMLVLVPEPSVSLESLSPELRPTRDVVHAALLAKPTMKFSGSSRIWHEIVRTEWHPALEIKIVSRRVSGMMRVRNLTFRYSPVPKE